jgi:Protein of unknown function (DUF3592)
MNSTIISFLFVSSLLGLGFGIKGLLSYDVASRVRAAGVETEGTILRRWKTSGGNRSIKGPWMVEFRFETHGRERIIEQEVSLGFYENTKVGESVTVRYIPANPYVARIVGEENTFAVGCYVAVGILVLDVILVGIMIANTMRAS